MDPNSSSPAKIEIVVEAGTPAELPFYCVSTAKFTILSLLTGGLYEIYWFYKNGKQVKAQSGRDISPFWRAVFAPVYCFSFATHVNSEAASVSVASRVNPALIAVIFGAMVLLERLPDPYWLLSFLSFLPLIPLVRQIRLIHEAVRPGYRSEVGWSASSYGAAVLGSIFVGVVVLQVFAPPTRVLRHSEIPSSYTAELVEAGLLDPGERLQFFYSAGIFSILEVGSLLTEKRVISYETVEDGLCLASVTFPEILNVQIAFSDSFLDDTVVTVSTVWDEEFILLLSPEGGYDREFVSELEARVPPRPPPEPDQHQTHQTRPQTRPEPDPG